MLNEKIRLRPYSDNYNIPVTTFQIPIKLLKIKYLKLVWRYFPQLGDKGWRFKEFRKVLFVF